MSKCKSRKNNDIILVLITVALVFFRRGVLSLILIDPIWLNLFLLEGAWFMKQLNINEITQRK